MKLRRVWAVALVLALGSSIAVAQPEVLFPPFEDAESRALAALSAARTSVDVAQYNIRNERFFDALSDLRARGVRVRIVVDAKNARQPWNTLDDRFEAAGFDLVRYENTRSRYAIMHHKFTIIDDALVLTGSYNWNHTAQVVNDENMIVLREPALISAYREEFEELRGAPEVVGGGGAGAARVLFSPEDRPRDAVLDAIRNAQHRVLVAMFAFKDTSVARALRDAARRGVAVTLVTEAKQADTTNADETVASGGARVIVGANRSSAHSAMHQKFCVVDDTLVITGACNWTYTAFTASNEDVLLLRDPLLARRYTAAFGALVRRYDAGPFLAADYGIARADAAAHFVVHMPRTQPGEEVVVTGDHPALGDWDPERGVVLRTSESIFPTWAGSVRLPAGSRVAWKAVIRRTSGPHLWELGADRVTQIDSDGVDGVVDVSFRDLVDVDVRASVSLPAGAELRLVGADSALGAWNPALGWPLTPDPVQPGVFSARVPLPGRAWISAKLVLVPASGSLQWERGSDRLLEVHNRDGPQAIDLGAFRD